MAAALDTRPNQAWPGLLGPSAPWRRVAITGASSGLGAGLALACARPGSILHLHGQHEARLASVGAQAEALGATVHLHRFDVRDVEASRRFAQPQGGLDLAIANAGIGAGSEGGAEPTSQIRAILAVNLDGALNLALPAFEAMARQPEQARWRGRIVVVGSIAGFVPAVGAPSYCASKAALRVWAEATAPLWRRQGVALTLACPGYIRTAMTAQNRFPMPGLMTPGYAAARILRSAARCRTRTVFPWWLGLAARLGDLLPPRLRGELMLRGPAKAPIDP